MADLSSHKTHSRPAVKQVCNRQAQGLHAGFHFDRTSFLACSIFTSYHVHKKKGFRIHHKQFDHTTTLG